MQKPEFYLKVNYPVTFYPDEEGGYVAEIKEIPGCITQGETMDETFSNIEEARHLWIKTAYEYGDEIPLPSTETGYSSKLLVRMPRTLHQRLSESAAREGVSMNQYVVALLSEANAMKAIEPMKQLIEQIYGRICSNNSA